MKFYRVTDKIYKPGEKIWETGENNGLVNNRENIDKFLSLVTSGSGARIQTILNSFQGTSQDGVRGSYIEAVLEYVRAQEFSTLPVRFKNMHVLSSLKSAQYFRTKYRPSNNQRIYEIEAPINSQYFSGDMNMYTYAPLSANLKCLIDLSSKYWRGDFSETPFEEIILCPNSEAIVKAEL
jgi:hypothetical protein